MKPWLANGLRVVFALVFLSVWSFVVVPMFNMPQATAYWISLPIGFGLSTFLALTWRES